MNNIEFPRLRNRNAAPDLYILTTMRHCWEEVLLLVLQCWFFSKSDGSNSDQMILIRPENEIAQELWFCLWAEVSF